jgi:MFS family permease
MIGSVPLAALDALGSKSAVSVVFAAGSALGLGVTLNIGKLEQRFARRFILSGGFAALFCSAALFAWGPTWTIVLAIALRAAHASIFSVGLSLYIMDYFGKGEMVQVESRRAVYLAVAWILGPTLGAWLYGSVESNAPFFAAMGFSVVLTAYHWKLRVARNPVLRAPSGPVPGVVPSVRRYFRQRHLRAAYLITCIRSIFWSALFIYGPIYVVEAGLPEWSAGLFLSAASAALFVGPFVSRASDIHGVRTMLIIGFVVTATALGVLTVLGDPTPIGLPLWLIGAIGGGILDTVANIPFMRLVRPRERTAMTTVFSTWREVSFFVTPALAALVLLVGPLWLLYPVIAALMLGGAALATTLPRRL